MGLGLEVGILADLKTETVDEEGYEYFRNQFDLLNALLNKNNLPAHNEPEDVPIFTCGMYGYGGLHYLRRIAAHLLVNGTVPDPCVENPTGDLVYQECYDAIATMQDARSPEEKRFDHLLCHSDAQGFYIPVEFDEVLLDLDETGLLGFQVGSSSVLVRECTALAEAIGLPTDIDPQDAILNDNCKTQGQGTGWHRYGIESYVCIQLLNAARHSVVTGAAILFT
ncbi:hypothetical protein [Gloeobacter violaceus]|uniref:Glr2695 protein n=1 Tax=Gloeobacter violaceus (strain ATCC 29082 / PCC 7421) TaxID=251221 RepID=Q7NH42_GLOVI|nr:hypothetical protein [Gloeobacter violaceus]BAC90636.1 glr2695 [Gloeobacter violaceus PCC 7421]